MKLVTLISKYYFVITEAYHSLAKTQTRMHSRTLERAQTHTSIIIHAYKRAYANPILTQT